MADTKLLSPADLLFDAANPRLPMPNQGQREIWRTLASLLDKKLVRMAGDVVAHGLDQSNLPIVVASGDDAKRYVVLDGNRRLAALKALENPDALVGALSQANVAELRKYGEEYQQNPVERISCLIFKERHEADHWIELRHSGQLEGAGILPWGADDASRWRARSGHAEFHTQVLDWLEKHGHLDAARRRGKWTTTLRRILGTPEVREKLGITLAAGELQIVGPHNRVAKALMHVIDDVAKGEQTSRTLSKKTDRLAYAKALPADIVVPLAKTGSASDLGTKPQRKKAAKYVRAKPRDYLIPNDCVLSVRDARCKDIEEELRTLPLSSYENAVSVLFRVFLELSIDAYVIRRKVSKVTKDSPLAQKMAAVADDLFAQQLLTKDQCAPVRRAAQKDSFLAPSIKLMHSYVHNAHIFPTQSDLRNHWNSLQPFVMAIWPP